MSEYSVEEILKAKRIARNAGYDVTLPDNKIDIAKNIAKEAGYSVRKKSSLEQAMEVATDAGYTLRRGPEAKPDNPIRHVKPAPDNTKIQVKPEPDNNKLDDYGWAEKQAAKYL